MTDQLNTAREALENAVGHISAEDWEPALNSVEEALAALNATPAAPAKKPSLTRLLEGMSEDRHGELITTHHPSAGAPSREAICTLEILESFLNGVRNADDAPARLREAAAYMQHQAQVVLNAHYRHPNPPIPAVLAEREEDQGSVGMKPSPSDETGGGANWRRKAAALWRLLDDIDTASDVAKADDAAYRRFAERIQRKRFGIMSGEEFDCATKPRCYCPPGRCMAPSIMGSPPRCLDPDRAAPPAPTNAEGGE